MLPAHGDLQMFGGIRRERRERLAHAPAIEQLGRLAGLMGWIARVRGVDGVECAMQSIGHETPEARGAMSPSHSRTRARRGKARPDGAGAPAAAARSTWAE